MHEAVTVKDAMQAATKMSERLEYLFKREDDLFDEDVNGVVEDVREAFNVLEEWLTDTEQDLWDRELIAMHFGGDA